MSDVAQAQAMRECLEQGYGVAIEMVDALRILKIMRRAEDDERLRATMRYLASLRLPSLAKEADEIDFMIMRWAQRNPRVCCSNHPTGEAITFGGRRQPL